MPATSFAPSDVQQLIETRRDLHSHPELAFEETRTAAIVAERLRSLGLEPRTGVGRTGVIATVEGGRPGRTVLLRADMDALPIQEENEAPYRSQSSGKMHACGHDCHTAILLGVAKQLQARAAGLAGRAKLVFQPAEEAGGGAQSMIDDGALRDPRPDAAFGLHVWQDLDLGQVGVTSGPMMAAVDFFKVTVTGIATMNGTVRAFDTALWRELPGQFERIVQGVAQAFRCRATVEYKRYNGPTVNDPAMAAIARAAAAEVVGETNVVDDLRTMGGEDFSAFLLEVPGCFIAIGSRNESRGLVHGHHHPRFDVDEDCLAIGAEILLRTAQRYLAT